MKVVIVGGGFGGVKAALELTRHKKIDVTLISDRDHFLFYPALYATATGKSRHQSILPLQHIFAGTNVKLVIDHVTAIDDVRKLIITKQHQLTYDRAIFALGVVTSYFGISGLDTYSYSIKSAPEIVRFKQHLHHQLTINNKLDKNYIIVGAGPTGTELSAALSHYLRHITKRHGLRVPPINISLVEAAPRVLPRMSERASELVQARLKKVGVTVMTNKKVESADDDSIVISGKVMTSKTIVWTSGVSNHPFFKEHADIFRLANNGKVDVDDRLKVNHHIYVIGDNANTTYAGLAQTAIYDGIFVAKDIVAEMQKKPGPAYKPRKQPVVIPVGENWSILEFGSLRLTGYLASMIRKAADFIGYLDYFPVRKAYSLYASKTKTDEDCPVCW